MRSLAAHLCDRLAGAELAAARSSPGLRAELDAYLAAEDWQALRRSLTGLSLPRLLRGAVTTAGLCAAGWLLAWSAPLLLLELCR